MGARGDRPVFDGANPLEILSAVSACAIEPPSSYVEELDPALERTVLRALARAPSDRFQSAEEFLVPVLAIAHQDVRFRDGRMLDLALPDGLAPPGAPTVEIDA